jgi:quercetin dioxygenase-like cupin family protein
MSIARAFSVVVLASVTTFAMTACSGPVPSDHSTMTHASGTDHDMVTTVNGLAPVGTPSVLQQSVKEVDETAHGVRHLVYREVRAAGTRSPIHVHPSGGITCIMSGEMTLFLEGLPPRVAQSGDCYWMPPNTPMYGYSSGSTDATFFDSFDLAPGEEEWDVVEVGQEGLNDNFGH